MANFKVTAVAPEEVYFVVCEECGKPLPEGSYSATIEVGRGYCVVAPSCGCAADRSISFQENTSTMKWQIIGYPAKR